MAMTSIKIVDKLIREPKQNGEIVELLFKVPMGSNLPKGLKPLGDSIYRVLVSFKSWNKLFAKHTITTETEFIVEGQSKASVNKKGVPFITVNCMSIQVKPPKQKDKNKNVEGKELKKVTVLKEISKPVIPPWYKSLTDEDFVYINISDIDLELKDHNFGYIPVGRTVGTHQVAVSKKEDGRYTLISGFKQFVSAKVYNKEKIRAYIFEGTKEEFDKQFNIIR